jgi:hypothetical protein
VSSFIWRKKSFITFFAGFFWIATAYSMVQIDYLGFGSMNVIQHDVELGDRYGDTTIFYLLASFGLIMMAVGFFDVLSGTQEAVTDAYEGRWQVAEDTRKWDG